MLRPKIPIDALLNAEIKPSYSPYHSHSSKPIKKEYFPTPIPSETKHKPKPIHHHNNMTADTASRMAIQSLLNDDRHLDRHHLDRHHDRHHDRHIPRSSPIPSLSKEPMCDVCFKRFTQRADVRKHKKTVHDKARDFHCAECPLSFGEVSNRHLISLLSLTYSYTRL